MFKKRRIQLVVLVLMVSLSLPTIVYAVNDSGGLPIQLGVDEYTDELDVVNYEMAAENDINILYADFKKGLFALKNKESNDIWYSTPPDALLDEITVGRDLWSLRSQLDVGYIYNEDLLTAETYKNINSQKGCIENGTINVSRIKNGIIVEYGFSEIGSTIPVTYKLENDYLTASIDTEEIDEGNQAVLINIRLLPAFGAGNWEEEGSILIPDGSGALFDFNNGKDCPAYESPVYGENLEVFKELNSMRREAVRLPVFATIKENKALMGIITSGDGSASIRAMNGNPSRGYNAVSSQVNLRALETVSMFKNQLSNSRKISRVSEMFSGKYEIRYYPLHNNDCNYMDVATKYRDYLIAEKGLKRNSQKPSLAIDIYGSIDKKAAMMGIEYNKQLPLTTFDQAQTIINDLTERGVKNLSVRYLGWDNNGMLNSKIPQKAVPVSSLGGKNNFIAFANSMKDKGFSLYPNVDFMQYRKGSSADAVKTVFNEVVYRNDRLRSVYATRLGMDPIRLLTPQKIVGAANRYLSSYAKLSINSISLDTAGSYSYSNNTLKKDGFHRYYFPAEIEKLMKFYKDKGTSLALSNANAYAIPYAERIYDAPTLCSGYDMFDYEIPFYQLVTHGYVSSTVMPMALSSDRRVNLLKAVESGSELLYGGMYADASQVTGTRFDYLYGTNYQLWIDDAVDAYQRYMPLLDKVYDKAIIRHKELLPDLIMTEFEGGICVIINYNKTEVTFDGRHIDAEGYIVIEEAGN